MTPIRRKNGWAAKFVQNGHQHWVPGSPWPTKRQAQEAERRYRDRLNERRSEETCASFSERWLEEWPRPADATQRLYAAAAKRFAEEFGPTPLGDVERLSARTWALGVPRSVSRVIGTMYEDARNVGLVESNPFANLRLPQLERRATVRPPTMDEYKALLDATPILGGYGPEFRAMIEFSAWTGIRQGEMFGLQWQDIGEDEITVARSRKVNGSLGLPKNGKVDTMPFPPPARVLDKVPRRPDDPFVFHSPRGRPLLKGTFGWSWQKVKASAGVDVRWHSLRHLCATNLLALDLDNFAVSIQLRHTDGGVQVQTRYGHPSVDAARRRILKAFEVDDETVAALVAGSERGA